MAATVVEPRVVLEIIRKAAKITYADTISLVGERLLISGSPSSVGLSFLCIHTNFTCGPGTSIVQSSQRLNLTVAFRPNHSLTFRERCEAQFQVDCALEMYRHKNRIVGSCKLAAEGEK